MPYAQTTLSQFVTQISVLLDDTSNRYWTVPEIQYAVFEGLRVFGALTNYWRERGIFNMNPATPYYDLSTLLPTLRTRTYTLNQMVQEIQYEILENASGISGTGMSGQTSISAILNAIQSSRNRFVLDTRLPLSVHAAFGNPPPPDGMITFSQSAVYVHRAAWQDLPSTTWTNLWRQDEWAYDKGNALWTLEPGPPLSFSTAVNSPLKLQISPPPINEGVLEAITVDSIAIDTTNGAATFNVPDEWVHAIKYSALSEILGADSQLNDPLRAQYAESRYQQSVKFAKQARSILRMMANKIPLSLDSLVAIDAGLPRWRNQTGFPNVAGALYDLIAIAPGVPNQLIGITCDVVRSAPLPATGNDFIQLGDEDIDDLRDYVVHYLLFKCGGDEFKNTMPNYDSFMQAVSTRQAINAADIEYFTPLFAQPQKEWEMRPDKEEANA